MSYLLLIIVTLALGLGTQAYINKEYKKWSSVPISTGETGAQAARRMLDTNGLQSVAIEPIQGTLTDNFDPKAQVLHLSTDVYNGRSISSTAVACHEAGHAVQHSKGYAPARIRMAIVPVVSFCSNAWIFVLMIGIFMNLTSLVMFAIILYAAVVGFQLVTLPVEFDASHRALASLTASGLPEGEEAGARSVLTAAALTYVAAALASILQLLYFLGVSRNN